eukprot:4470394-Pyramimonas_sp.AAC.1
MTVDDGGGAFARAVRARSAKGGGKGEGGAGQTLGANEVAQEAGLDIEQMFRFIMTGRQTMTADMQ